MQSGQRQGPLRVQIACKRSEFGPALVQSDQVVEAKRMLLDGNVVQTSAGRTLVLSPCLPGCKEVQAKTKTGFKYDET